MRVRPSLCFLSGSYEGSFKASARVLQGLGFRISGPGFRAQGRAGVLQGSYTALAGVL